MIVLVVIKRAMGEKGPFSPAAIDMVINETLKPFFIVIVIISPIVSVVIELVKLVRGS